MRVAVSYSSRELEACEADALVNSGIKRPSLLLQDPKKVKAFMNTFNKECTEIMYNLASRFGISSRSHPLHCTLDASLLPEDPTYARSYVLTSDLSFSRVFVLEQILLADFSQVYRIYSKNGNNIDIKTWHEANDIGTPHTIFTLEDLRLFTKWNF